MKRLLLAAFLILSLCVTYAQVTTGTITGTVTDSKGQILQSASVKAVNLPTGTVYTTTSNNKGKYTLPNLPIGGPYSLTFSNVGHNLTAFDNLTVNLADALEVNAVMEISGQTLSEVQVTAAGKNGIISSQRTGPSTNISTRMLQNLPTLSRNIQDFIRLTPSASAFSAADGSPGGISFNGQNNKFNQFTIDGANATDVFGLSSTGYNGGQAGVNPIPLESIASVQVLSSPYDVTQSGFTGGGINAVSKSGTNEFHGSAYGTLQNQGLVGKGVTTRLKYASFKNNTYGASLGGAIIKNKLFFFVNAEHFDNSTPVAYDPSQPNSGSKFNVATLQGLYDFIRATYPSYDPGSFTSINKTQKSTSVFGRLDYVISPKSRLTVRHSYVNGSNYIISRSPTSITFANSGYYMKNTTNSSVAELNTTFSSRSSNVLRVTYNNISDHRETSPFPNLSITDAGGLTYNLGGDYSSQANSLVQNNWTVTDNFTLYRGNHTITFGTNNEFYNSSNVFLQDYAGSYSYSKTGVDGISWFENNTTAPSSYYIYYNPKQPGSKNPANLHAGQVGIYAQDVFAVTSNFKLTYGVRIDAPLFFNKPVNNTAFNADANFAGYNNRNVPKFIPLVAPRVGFNWDVKKDGKTQLRGGLGIFNGRAPFVWISNQFGSDGVSLIKYTTAPANLRFNYNPKALLGGAYVPSGNTPPATEVDLTDKNFKVPQTLRGNLAVDQKLPWWGLVGTIEAVYTKKINDINYQNLNVGPQAGTINIGGNTRPWYNFARKDAAFTDVMLLNNTSKGYAYNFTAQIQKPYSQGWQGSIAYTFGHSYSLNDGTSSVALSNWRYAPNVNGLNSLSEGRANFDLGSRAVGYVMKTFTYANNHMATTIGLVYTGQSGQPFSYTYSKNITGDDVTGKNTANNNAGLMYIPTEAQLNDPNGYASYKFVDLTSTSNGVTTVIKTAAQEWADFKSFIENNPGLKKHEGQIIPKNSDRTPWENHFDLKLSQDFMWGQHKLEFSLDMLNVNNLIDHKSGWNYTVANQNADPLIPVSQGTSPTFNFDQTKQNLINGVYRPYTYSDLLSRWRGQLSVKYSF
jgi:outer membrane receptor protein involved in Fe transport